MEEVNASLIFSANKKQLKIVEDIINDGLLDDMVESYDEHGYTTNTLLVYTVSTGYNESIDIFKIKEMLPKDVVVIFALTDSTSFIDVISTSDEFDAHVENDIEKINELCSLYGLYFIAEEPIESYILNNYDEDSEYDDEYDY